MTEPYLIAQDAMAKLKSAVSLLLRGAPGGMTNATIGRSLGIYAGHVGHQGHLPRTILEIMKAEGVVEQEETTKTWKLRSQVESAVE